MLTIVRRGAVSRSIPYRAALQLVREHMLAKAAVVLRVDNVFICTQAPTGARTSWCRDPGHGRSQWSSAFFV